MTTETVPSATAVDQPVTYTGTVTELRRIADALETLGTLPSGEKEPYISLSLLLDTVEGVDAAARAVLGRDAETSQSGANWYHLARGGPKTGRGYLCVQTSVDPVDEREQELKKLRQRITELEATTDRDGLTYSREADDPTPVSPARVPLHTGSVVNGDALIVDGVGPKCSSECDDMCVPGAATGLARGFHHDDCPVVPVLEERYRQRLADGDERPCAHRGDGGDCECNGNDQPSRVDGCE